MNSYTPGPWINVVNIMVGGGRIIISGIDTIAYVPRIRSENGFQINDSDKIIAGGFEGNAGICTSS